MDDLDVTNQLVGACIAFLGSGLLLGYLFSLARGIWTRKKS